MRCGIRLLENLENDEEARWRVATPRRAGRMNDMSAPFFYQLSREVSWPVRGAEPRRVSRGAFLSPLGVRLDIGADITEGAMQFVSQWLSHSRACVARRESRVRNAHSAYSTDPRLFFFCKLTSVIYYLLSAYCPQYSHGRHFFDPYRH
jgi:hypothetical protein